jgi:hypothetical protein
MDTPNCSPGCCDIHSHSPTLRRELNLRWWFGITIVAASCAMAYAAYSFSALFWIPCAAAAWYGTYNTIYSKGCAGCGGSLTEEASEPPQLNALQRATRRGMAHRFLAAAIVIAAGAAAVLPILWPLAAIAGWFAASFYVAAWKGYVGCPEVGAIPTWLSGRRVATLCPPMDRRDARNEVRA